MTLEMRYREIMEQGLEYGIEQGIEQGLEQTAIRMLQSKELSDEKIALYSGLSIEQVQELKNKLE